MLKITKIVGPAGCGKSYVLQALKTLRDETGDDRAYLELQAGFMPPQAVQRLVDATEGELVVLLEGEGGVADIQNYLDVVKIATRDREGFLFVTILED